MSAPAPAQASPALLSLVPPNSPFWRGHWGLPHGCRDAGGLVLSWPFRKHCLTDSSVRCQIREGRHLRGVSYYSLAWAGCSRSILYCYTATFITQLPWAWVFLMCFPIYSGTPGPTICGHHWTDEPIHTQRHQGTSFRPHSSSVAMLVLNSTSGSIST